MCFRVQLYRIQNPQAPVVQNDAQSAYCYDEYPNGANAVVAVISYTGFDMEDAMIINKSSFERGFGHASVYKTIVRAWVVWTMTACCSQFHSPLRVVWFACAAN